MKIIFITLTLLCSLSLMAQENPYLMMKDIQLALDSVDYQPDNAADTVVEYQKIYPLELKFTSWLEQFHSELVTKIDQQVALSGGELTLLHKALKTFFVIHSRTLALVEAWEPKTKELFTSDVELSTRHLLWLNMRWSGLTRMLKVYQPFLSNEKLRRLLNSADSAYAIEKDQLLGFIYGLFSRSYLGALNNGRISINNSTAIIEDLRTHSALFDRFFDLLKSQMGSEFVTSADRSDSEIDRYDQYAKKDGRARFLNTVFHHLSGAFGNFAGSIRWRKGWLDNNPTLNNEIASKLIPFDMITERTPFALTDKFIPGNFGHNAIWLGTKDQLQALGLWEHPSVKPIQRQIEQGMSILETDRKGTHLKDIAEFMKIDEFAIMRNKDLYSSPEKMENLLEVGIAQLGKTYDFNFDVETTDRLVCSELLYQSFGDIKWPTEYIAGRNTISPDNVTKLMYYENAPNKLIYYVAAFKKGVLEYLDLLDLAPKLKYRLNDERSTAEVPYFEERTKKCNKMMKGEQLFNACTTVWVHHIY